MLTNSLSLPPPCSLLYVYVLVIKIPSLFLMHGHQCSDRNLSPPPSSHAVIGVMNLNIVSIYPIFPLVILKTVRKTQISSGGEIFVTEKVTELMEWRESTERKSPFWNPLNLNFNLSTGHSNYSIKWRVRYSANFLKSVRKRCKVAEKLENVQK